MPVPEVCFKGAQLVSKSRFFFLGSLSPEPTEDSELRSDKSAVRDE